MSPFRRSASPPRALVSPKSGKRKRAAVEEDEDENIAAGGLRPIKRVKGLSRPSDTENTSLPSALAHPPPSSSSTPVFHSQPPGRTFSLPLRGPAPMPSSPAPAGYLSAHGSVSVPGASSAQALKSLNATKSQNPLPTSSMLLILFLGTPKALSSVLGLKWLAGWELLLKTTQRDITLPYTSGLERREVLISTMETELGTKLTST
ncbi:hypothetical protein QBC44DRAFT_311321 [Cladorrhinum sp. PSN332]|nr:hypothetical protein QBC44DRAFT_311321 [Cladorrhinum sp. PSN332]